MAFLIYYSYFSIQDDIEIANYIQKSKLGVDDVSIFHDKLREETYNYTKIINEITVLRQIEETTSKRVKDFYEESPYPKYKFRETAQEYSNLNLDLYNKDGYQRN